MTPEQKFHKFVRDTLPKSWDLLRIETSTTNGVPDLNLLIPHPTRPLEIPPRDVWMELKATKDARVVVRPEQYAWGVKRTHAGGKVFVLHRKLYATEPLHWQLFDYSVPSNWSRVSNGMSCGVTRVFGYTAENLIRAIQNLAHKS